MGVSSQHGGIRKKPLGKDTRWLMAARLYSAEELKH